MRRLSGCLKYHRSDQSNCSRVELRGALSNPWKRSSRNRRIRRLRSDGLTSEIVEQMPDRLIIGCGYLGQRVARTWRQAGHRTWVMTRREERAAELRQDGFEAFVGDVVDWDAAEELPRFEAVLYAVGFDRSGKYDRREVYVNGLANMLSKLSGRFDRLVYVSSTSVYGQTDGGWVDEETDCEPLTESGRVCLEAEQVVQSLAASAATTIILRLAGIYGPGRLLRRVEQVMRGEPLAGQPQAWLNLIHVDDAALAVDAAVKSADASGTYLVSDGSPVTRRDYYSTLAELLAAPLPPFDETLAAPARTPGLNKRCRNRRLVEALHVTLRYPTHHVGLAHALAEQSGGG